MRKGSNAIVTKTAAALAALVMLSGLSACSAELKNTEPPKPETKESVVSTTLSTTTEAPVMTTEAATTEPIVTEAVTTEPAVETTEAAVAYIDLNNVILFALNFETGNKYYTMEIAESKVMSDVPRETIAYSIDDDDYYGDVISGMYDGNYMIEDVKYTGIGLMEGLEGHQQEIFDNDGNKVGILWFFERPDETWQASYIIFSRYGNILAREVYKDNKLLDYKVVSAAEVFGVNELPSKEFNEFLKTLDEINFDTIVEQWEAFQS